MKFDGICPIDKFNIVKCKLSMDTLWHTMQECKLCYPCLACVCDTRLKVVNRVVQDRQEIGEEEIMYEPELLYQKSFCSHIFFFTRFT